MALQNTFIAAKPIIAESCDGINIAPAHRLLTSASEHLEWSKFSLCPSQHQDSRKAAILIRAPVFLSTTQKYKHDLSHNLGRTQKTQSAAGSPECGLESVASFKAVLSSSRGTQNIWETHNSGPVTLTKIRFLTRCLVISMYLKVQDATPCGRCLFSSFQKMWPVLFPEGRALNTVVLSFPVDQNHTVNFKRIHICPWPSLTNLTLLHIPWRYRLLTNLDV